jgi:RNA polymerase sigma-70 factor (ECF subfamily)
VTRSSARDALGDAFVARRAELRLVASRIIGRPDCLDDVLQDAYVKLIGGRRNEPVLNPFGYCCRVVRSAAFDHHRRVTAEATHLTLTETGQLPDMVDEREADSGIDERRLLKHLQASLSTFPERSQRMFVLAFVDGKTQREIGKILGVSASLVNAALQEMTLVFRQIRPNATSVSAPHKRKPSPRGRLPSPTRGKSCKTKRRVAV